MRTVFTFLLSESVLIPIVAGLLTFKKLTVCWLPFFMLLILAFFTEVLSFLFIDFLNTSNAIIIQIYSLLECCLIIYQFFLWQNKKRYIMFISIAAMCIAVFLIDNVVFANLSKFSPYFRVFYAFVVVLLGINQINSMMVNQEQTLFKSPVFVLSLAFIIFFTYQIIYEASFFIGSDKSVVANKIVLFFAYINVAVNLLYALSILLIRRPNDINYEKECAG